MFLRRTIIAAVVMLCGLPAAIAFDSYPLGVDPTHVAIGDMNGDGWVDLVTANNNQSISILLANPTLPGKFLGGAVVSINLAPLIPNMVALGDLNKDGRLDIVTGDTGIAATDVHVLLQNGAGAFPTVTDIGIGAGGLQPLYVLVLDINGDGNLDIVSANPDTGGPVDRNASISIIKGNGNGTFQAAEVKVLVGAGRPSWITAADVNGDSKPDLITVNGANNRLILLLSQANGTFSEPISLAIEAGGKFVAAADFNADGKKDLAVLLSPLNTSNSVYLLLGNGDGTFAFGSRTPAFPYNGAGALPDIVNPNFAVGDVTDDGILDILFVTDIGTTVPSNFGLKGIGDGTFQSATNLQFSVPGVGMFAALDDFNKDGQLDIATALNNPGTDGITVELLNQRATVSTVSPTGLLLNGTLPNNTITVTGTGFLAGAKVQIDGIDLVTSGSGTQLTADTSSFVFNKPGLLPVTVINPAPGGFASNSVFLSVYPTTVGSFTVTNTNDSGVGSLRFAMQNARNGDSIQFDATVFDLTNSDAATLINVLSELPALDDGNVTIDAQDRRVTVNGSGAGSAAGLTITSSSNTVRGLSIIGFTKSGIVISGGAKSNTIGGSRATGTGANKQGLRISNNGAFGVEITGAGTDSNVVKGCWIGLEASGTEASPNLAGVIIAASAKSNTIGSTDPNEANVISGNGFEGITITGDGTDDNVISGNLVGVAAVATGSSASSASTADGAGSRAVDSFGSRSQVGNGSAGVFLSKGTKGSRVGGDTDNEANIIAFNGGNGIEVRAATSRKNGSRRNRITRNVQGGIALFDGSNDGIQAPTIDSVEFLDTRSSSDTAGRGLVKARVAGRTTGEGFVELFLDDGNQGGTFATRVSVVSGAFSADIDALDTSNITATFTDANGNTSPFAVFGTNTDTDGDGVSDLVETLAGTDPNSSSDAPTDGGTVSVDKASVKLTFSSTGKDAISATLRLILPENYEPKDSVVAIKFGEVSESLTLDAKGASPKANATVRVKGFAGDTGLLSFAVKNKDLRSALAASGMGNETTPKEGERVTLNVMVALTSGGERVFYTGKVKLLYKSVENKGGKAGKTR